MALNSTFSDIIRFIRMPAALLAITDNLIILIVVLRYAALRNNTSNLLLAQLAVADALIGVNFVVRIVTNELQLVSDYEKFDATFCMAIGSLSIFSIHISQTTMLSIAIERLICIKFPIRYRKLRLRRCWLIYCAFSLLLSLVGTGAMFIGFPYGDKVLYCSTGSRWTRAYSVYFVVLTSGLSFVICGIHSYVILLVHSRNISSKSTKAERNLTTTLTTLVIAYIIFWCIPAWIYFVALVIGVIRRTLGIILFSIVITNFLHSTLNFGIYMCMHSEFRKHFLLMFSCAKNTKVHSNFSIEMNRCNPKRTLSLSEKKQEAQKPFFLITSRFRSLRSSTAKSALQIFHR